MSSGPPPDPALVPEPLLTAVLLAATAGLLDGATYLLHGHVFATAMTGNTILLGISAVSGQWREFVRHVVPITAFVCGVWGSKVLRRFLKQASAVTLVFEAGTLVVAGLLPLRFPEMVFTGAISFVAAMQVAGMQTVGPYSYSSTFITGDLLRFTESLYEGLHGDPERTETDRPRIEARDLGLVWTGLLAGAAIGAFGAWHLGRYTYWLPVPLLLALVPVVVRRVRGGGNLVRHSAKDTRFS